MVNNRNFIFSEDNHIARALQGGLGGALGGLGFGGLGNIFGMSEDRLTLQQMEALRQQQDFRAILHQQQSGMLGQGALMQMAARLANQSAVTTPIERLEARLARCSYESWIMAGDRSTFQEWRRDHA